MIMGITKDEGLIGNEKIEEYIEMLKKQPSDEVLAALLTSIRRRMKEKGQFVVGVDPSPVGNVQVRIMESTDGRKWVPAFTSFEEEMMKGGNQVMSTFLADIGQLMDMVLNEPSMDGIILNPWNLRFTLSKEIIRVVKG